MHVQMHMLQAKRICDDIRVHCTFIVCSLICSTCLQNQLYFTAIKHAVQCVRSQGLEPRVLDIGTGTGLLAMMAAKAGAKCVTACEVSESKSLFLTFNH